MDLFTIGFTKKSAKDFFGILERNGVARVIDVRLNNTSQLAGFTKANDLRYFLEKVTHIGYEWWEMCAPPEGLLKRYQAGRVGWPDYVAEYNRALLERDVIGKVDRSKLPGACLLCSEPTAERCHRRLLAEYFQREIGDVKIVHL
jgi:uncharacterized protein (DUF488 family)